MSDENRTAERVLVEDEQNTPGRYEALLQKWGLAVAPAFPALKRPLARFSSSIRRWCGIELPGMDGLTLLSRLGEELRNVPAIIITGKGSEERAVAAIEAGAFWYIEKPLKAAILRSLLDRALGKARDRQQVAALTHQLRQAGRIGELVGAAKPMQDVMRVVEQVAPSSASVLITGETGSGWKSAPAFHQLSLARELPYRQLSIAPAIPESTDGKRNLWARAGLRSAAEGDIGC